MSLKGQRISYRFESNGDLLVKRYWDHKLEFDLFNKDLRLKKQWSYKLKSGMNSEEKLMTFDLIEGQLLLLVQQEDGGKKRNFVQINLSTTPAHKILLFTARGSKGMSPKLHLQKADKKYYLWYESLSHPFKKQKRIDIQSFDQNFELGWHDSLIIDYKDRLMQVERLRVNAKGNYELILRKFFVNTMKTRYGKPNSEIWHYHFKDTALIKNILLDKELFYTGLRIEDQGDAWQISGLYSKKFKHRDGLFDMQFSDGQRKLKHFEPLSPKIGRALHPLGFRNKIHDLVLDYRIQSDSFVYWVAEEFYYRLRGTPSNPSYDLYFGSVLILKTDQDSELVDWRVIGKRQTVNSRRQYFASYELELDSNDLKFYVNPSKKIWLKRKSFEYLAAKEEPGFFVMVEDIKTPDLNLSERYYPMDENRFPLLGSISQREGKMFMILVAKNGKYYLPVYADFD